MRTKPPFRADHVGSLLRPTALKDARARKARGEISVLELRAVEDHEIARAISQQQALGLQGVTDGEFRRFMWHKDFLQHLDGIELVNDAPMQFKGIQAHGLGLRIADKIAFSRHPHVEHFRFVKDRTKVTAKMTVPSPSVLAPINLYDLQNAERPAYHDLDALYDDLAAAYRKAILVFYEAGCRYLQIDEVRLVAIADPNYRANRGLTALDVGKMTALFVRLVTDALRDRPADMVISMHNCRGNFRSRWAAEGGYEPVADALFNIKGIDAYFLEYDSERAGGFEPLRLLPKHKMAVLGLVTSKTGALEGKDLIKRRIDEAAKYVDIARLCLSPQCGFASTEEGNELAEQQQWAKLAFVKEIADEVWGNA
jgi:5-methyltetrahydropteroyltriglutamate--homocysteine methyltransferase